MVKPLDNQTSQKEVQPMAKPQTWHKVHTVTGTPVYQNNDGRMISIHAGQEPWTWSVKTQGRFTETEIDNIIEAYVDAGLRQHELGEGYDKVLTIPA
jgi:hypothetical protein